MSKVNVVQSDDDNIIATEVIAEHILSISEAVKKIRNGRLNNKAIYLLIQNACPNVHGKPVSMADVRAVLDGIESLEETYLK